MSKLQDKVKNDFIGFLGALGVDSSGGKLKENEADNLGFVDQEIQKFYLIFRGVFLSGYKAGEQVMYSKAQKALQLSADKMADILPKL